MKVAMLTHVYPRFAEDPMPPFIEYIAEALQQLGVDVTVLTPYHPRFARVADDHSVHLHTYRYTWPARAHQLGYANTLVHDCRLKRTVYLLAPFLFASGTAHLWRLHQQERFDLIHAHWAIPNGFMGALVAHSFRLPLVITLHGSDVFLARQNPLFFQLAQWAFRNSACITSVSPEFCTRLQPFDCDAKLRLIPNGVACERFQQSTDPATAPGALRQQLQLAEDTPVLFALGRIVWKKGFDVLLRALPAIRAACPRAVLLLGGDGSALAQMQALAHSLGVADMVRFVGAIPHSQVVHYYALADLFVMPAIHDPKGNADGCPTVVLEAMASGVPVVASELGGIPLVVSHARTGWLVPEGDVAALAQAVTVLLNDVSLRQRLADAAHRHVETSLTWRQIAQRFVGIYEECLGRGANTQSCK